MTGQMWQSPEDGGYLYSDELSSIFRMQVRPLNKMRQFCDGEDGTQKGLHRGELFTWTILDDLPESTGRLNEADPMPESSATMSQGSLTVTEWGRSVPYTAKLDALAKAPIVNLLDKLLKNHAAKTFDKEAWLQFDRTALRAAPTSGTSTTAITLTTNGATATTNNVELGTGHIKALSDAAMERNIPPHRDDCYFMVGHPSTFRTMRNSLEGILQYTADGLTSIRHGEIGRYEGVRFVQQTNIAKGGANDSTTFNVWTGTADEWNNGKSSWAFFFGADTVTEAICIPEEIRAKVPHDYGRAKGIGWYGLGGFGITHTAAAHSRIIKWDSAA